VPLRVWIELSEDGTSWTIPGERVNSHRLHLLSQSEADWQRGYQSKIRSVASDAKLSGDIE
jgi:hypothetical protein